MTVSFYTWAKSKKDRVYRELKVEDEVRGMLTKDSKTKGYMPKWSTNVFKVTFIKGNEYMANNYRRKVYSRHELLKV